VVSYCQRCALSRCPLSHRPSVALPTCRRGSLIPNLASWGYKDGAFLTVTLERPFFFLIDHSTKRTGVHRPRIPRECLFVLAWADLAGAQCVTVRQVFLGGFIVHFDCLALVTEGHFGHWPQRIGRFVIAGRVPGRHHAGGYENQQSQHRFGALQFHPGLFERGEPPEVWGMMPRYASEGHSASQNQCPQCPGTTGCTQGPWQPHLSIFRDFNSVGNATSFSSRPVAMRLPSACGARSSRPDCAQPVRGVCSLLPQHSRFDQASTRAQRAALRPWPSEARATPIDPFSTPKSGCHPTLGEGATPLQVRCRGAPHPCVGSLNPPVQQVDRKPPVPELRRLWREADPDSRQISHSSVD
jgi:hypothetical protein